jgi:hypothetical protein
MAGIAVTVLAWPPLRRWIIAGWAGVAWRW